KIETKFSSFISTIKTGPSMRSGTNYENVYRIYCENDDSYRIIIDPKIPEDMEPGKQMTITKTKLLGRIKSLKIENHVYDVSFLKNPTILICFMIAFVVSILNLFSSNRIVGFLLAFSMIYIFF